MSTVSALRSSRGIAALGLCLVAAACNNDPGSGSLTIQYAFDAITSCNQDEENVITVEVELGDSVASDDVPCDNAGGDLSVNAPAGTYDVVVRGIDDEGDAVLDNLGGSLMDDRVEIIGGDTKVFPVTLSLVPAHLEVNLSVLNNGVFAQCTSTAITIKGVRVEAWGFAGQLKSHDFDLCDFDDFLAVPDEMRQINGRLFDQVVFTPLDAAGTPVGSATDVPLGAPVGAGKTVRLAIQCEDEDCSFTVLGGNPGGPTSDTEDPTGSEPDPTTGGNDPTTGGDPTGGDSTGA